MNCKTIKGLILFALVCFSGSQLCFAEQNMGIGLAVGSPMGITGKYYLSETKAIDATLGWNVLASTSHFQFHSTYLWNQVNAFSIENEPFDLFFGLGIAIRSNGGTEHRHTTLGPRAPIGVAYFLQNPKIELFTQIALNIGILPDSDVYPDFAVGARFYF